ncbi:MAG: PAS domain-containing protein, partial [Desulfuromonadales bacterium]|nr:PAS domain-containing protein [Desulfuromonadales bacterium]
MMKSLAGQSGRQNLERLRQKTVVCAAIYTLAALLIISAISVIPLVDRLKASEEASLLQDARIRAIAVTEYLDRITSIASQTSLHLSHAMTPLRQLQLSPTELRQQLGPRLRDTILQVGEVAGISRFEADGRLLIQAGIPIPAPALPSRPVLHEEPSIAPPMVIDQRPYITVKLAIFDQDQHLWTDLYLFEATKLQGIVWNPATLKPGGDALLGRMTEQQAEIFFPGRLGELEVYNAAADLPLFNSAMQAAVKGETGLLRRDRTADRHPDILAFTPIPHINWGLLVTTDQADLYAEVYRLLFSVIGIVALLAAAGGGGIFLLLRPLTGKVLVYSAELETLNDELKQQAAERKQALEDLRHSEREWAQTFEAITDAVAILDVQGRVLKMNRANTSFLASLSADIFAAGRCKVHFGLEPSTEICPFTQMLKTRSPEFGELYEPTNDRYYQVAIYPLLDEEGELWGGVHIAQDITEQKKLEHLKDEMISSVSHEMRTPLTAMLGFVEYLLENPVPPEQQREFLQTVQRETERLNELISSFLDLQRLQSQLESYRLEPLIVEDLLREGVHLFAVASKKHQVSLHASSGLPLVSGDGKRLQQVLKNLLSNAIRYSPE